MLLPWPFSSKTISLSDCSMVSLNCPHCKHGLMVDETDAGSAYTCGNCSEEFLIPPLALPPIQPPPLPKAALPRRTSRLGIASLVLAAISVPLSITPITGLIGVPHKGAHGRTDSGYHLSKMNGADRRSFSTLPRPVPPPSRGREPDS